MNLSYFNQEHICGDNEGHKWISVQICEIGHVAGNNLIHFADEGGICDMIINVSLGTSGQQVLD